ncbi:MAG TPA: hypothetical protein VF705_10735 [Longimicrobium sp.]|jgi:hypothetical protein
MRAFLLPLLAVFLAVPCAARAQSATGRAPLELAGTWRGTSRCTAAGRPACHDEVVVYHVRQAGTPARAAPERLEWVMNKVVGGKEEAMGVLLCDAAPGGGVVCPMREWRWTFRMQGASVQGTLTSPTGVVWRNILVRRMGG